MWQEAGNPSFGLVHPGSENQLLGLKPLAVGVLP